MRVRVGQLALLSMLLVDALAIAPASAQKPADTAWRVPAEVARRHNPILPTTETIARGRELFVFVCAPCHGATGHGGGPRASSLRKRPADLVSALVQSRSDGTLFWQISTGRGEMPRPTLGEREVWAVVAYVRSLGEEARR